MADKEIERWITIKGAHIPVYEDGSIGIGVKEDNKAETVVKYPDDYGSKKDKVNNTKNAENVRNTIEDILKQAKDFNRDEDDMVDYVWTKLYDYYPQALPSDQSHLLLDNNKGNYDKDAKIGFVRVDLFDPSNGKLQVTLSPYYAYMSDFEEEDLQEMGIDV